MNEHKLDSKSLFYFCFVLWYGTEIIFNSNISLPNIENYLTLFLIFLLFVQIVFFQTYEQGELINIIIVSMLVIITTINSQQFYMLSSWLFIVAFKDADLDIAVRLAFKSLTIGILIIIGLCLFGIIPNTIIYRGVNERYSLGFSHPNQLGLSIFQWVLCYCYIRWENKGIVDIALLCVLAYFVHKVADSQTSVVCIILVSLFIVVIRMLEYFELSYNMILSKLCSLLSIVFMAGSIVLTWIDVKKNVVLSLLDLLLSRRFSLGHQVLEMFGVKLFGQRVYAGEAERIQIGIMSYRFYLDNAYANLWLRYGVVFTILFLSFYFLLYNKVLDNSKITVFLFVFSVYGIMEIGLCQFYNNIFLLLFAFLLYPNKAWPQSFNYSTIHAEGFANEESQSYISS